MPLPRRALLMSALKRIELPGHPAPGRSWTIGEAIEARRIPGGRLRASNNASGGATFQFTLPVDLERTR